MILLKAIRSTPHNAHVGCIYALAGLGTLLLSGAALPFSIALVWPAAALFVTMSGYFGRGPGVFGKTNGRLPISSRLRLGPVLIGQHLSLFWYRRRSRAWDRVLPNLLIGRQLNDREAEDAVRFGVTSVLDLTSEFSEARPFLAVRYLNLPILDLTAPTEEQLREAVDFIVGGIVSGGVLVHCKAGYSRSAAVVGAFLLVSCQADTAEEAIRWLRRIRPSIVIRPEATEALRRLQQTCSQRSPDERPSVQACSEPWRSEVRA